MLNFSQFDDLLLHDLESFLEGFSKTEIDTLTGNLIRRDDDFRRPNISTEAILDELSSLSVDQFAIAFESEEGAIAELSNQIHSYITQADSLFERMTEFGGLPNLIFPNLGEEILQSFLGPVQFDQASTNVAENTATSEYDIEIRFVDNNLTDSQRAIFTDAVNRWEQIIVGDIPDVFVRGIGPVDDLVINVSTPFIDGAGRVLGQAGPTLVRADSSLPIAGTMQFDAADVTRLESVGQLDEVILHEMGHVFGIGTLWGQLGLVQGTSGSDPRYVGNQAVQEYNEIFGLNANSIPVENTGGPGTRDSHWRESVFDNELMTGFLDLGQANPLSRVTAASLGDLGYDVNLSAATPYSPPLASV